MANSTAVELPAIALVFPFKIQKLHLAKIFFFFLFLLRNPEIY